MPIAIGNDKESVKIPSSLLLWYNPGMVGPTSQQAEFVRQLPLNHGVGTKAAIAAGYAPGSAHVASSRLLRNDNVIKALEVQSEALQVQSGIDLEWWLKEIKANITQAKIDKAWGPVTRMFELLGKQAGILTDKLQVDHIVSQAPDLGLSIPQLEAIIQITDQLSPEEIQVMIDRETEVIDGEARQIE